jgi:hypothetical protein
MELQPNPLSAMALINDVPVNMVHARRAVCDGGAHLGTYPRFFWLNFVQAEVRWATRRYTSTWFVLVCLLCPATC